MKAVVATAVLAVCLVGGTPQCLSEDGAPALSEPPLSVWSMLRMGEPVPGGISEYTYGLALSPDSHRIATLGDRLRIWDVVSGKPLGEPINIVGRAVAWSPSGTAVAAGTLDGRLVLSSPDTSHILWQTEGGKTAITAIAFSPDGRFLAASSKGDRTVRVLNALGKGVCQSSSAHKDDVTALTFAEGGKTLVSVSVDSTIRTWDPETCKELRSPIESKNGNFRMLGLHPGGTVVAVAAREGPPPNDRHGGVEFWDIKTGQAAATPLKGYGGTYGIGGLAFTEDGSRLMVADGSGALALIEWKTGRLLARGIANHDAVIVWRTVFSPNGDVIATAGKDRVLGIWSARVTPASLSPIALTSQKDYAFDGALPTLSDTSKVGAYARENQIFVREIDSGKVVLEAALKNRAQKLAISPDGQWLVAFDGNAHLWHVPTKRYISEWAYWGSEAFAFNATNTRLAIGATSRIFLIDCFSGKEIGHYQFGADLQYPRISRLLFDPTGRILLVVTEDGDVHRFDAFTLQPVGDPWRGLGRHGAIAFSFDGSRIAVARRMSIGESMQIVVLDAASGEQLVSPLEENLGWESALTFTLDGTHLLMAGANGSVSLWDAISGHRLARVTSGSQGPLRGIRFTRDAHHLYACDMGTYTKTDCIKWDVSLRALDAASSVGRPLLTPFVLSPIGEELVAIGSLSNAIDFRTNELNVRPGKVPILFLNMGTSRLIGTLEDNGKSGHYAAMVYADSALSAEMNLVSVPMNDGQITIFDVSTGKLVNAVDAERFHTFLFDGSLAFDRPAKGIVVVDPLSGHELRTLPYPPNDGISVLAAGSKRPTIVAGTIDGALLIGYIDSTAQSVFQIEKSAHQGPVVTLAFSADERVVASGGVDGRIQLFDMQKRDAVRTPWKVHEKAVSAMGFNADGTLLASGSVDGTIRVWNVNTELPVTNAVAAHTEPVLAVAFDPVNGRVLSFGQDGRLRSWAISQMPGKRGVR